ncbi:MAG: hypothetical protein QMD03_01220 [Syntrophales bacterium]|nr:hypothetical protein [Syntrophales bacterium]
MGTRVLTETWTNDLQEQEVLILSLKEEIVYLKKKTAGLRQELEYCKEVLAKNGIGYCSSPPTPPENQC